MKIIYALFTFILLSGCATTSPQCDVPAAEDNESTTIIVYRPNKYAGYLYSTPMSIDNCRVESLSSDSYVVYKLPPGNHRIAAETRNLELGGVSIVEQNFEQGETYYIKQTVNFTAFINEVTKEKALEDMPALEGVK